ncbi:unnamed protein product [Dibothriocephalus latus]|uniref:Uncharacterized protein n=1 Tax=Dibothriocephalus latus TaxID=60516 RepID=A0A3P7LN02_DIBLA|nr:unnamed protein product [Dibothriocephalus latus]
MFPAEQVMAGGAQAFMSFKAIQLAHTQKTNTYLGRGQDYQMSTKASITTTTIIKKNNIIVITIVTINILSISTTTINISSGIHKVKAIP